MEVTVRGGKLNKGEDPKNATSPQRDRERSRTNRVGVNTSGIKVLKKVQVVYYLTRNGLLEHPHYLEVSHLANHPLRLKDVTDRLSILRGKAMPSQYSWSCKRSYKNGYVWNDLTENDIIYPSQGAEYVLKGSELISAPARGRLEQCQTSDRGHTRIYRVTTNTHHQVEQPKYKNEEEGDDEEEEENEGSDEYEDKRSYASSNTPHSRCSRGVSTEELQIPPTLQGTQQQLDHSPPSTSSTISHDHEKAAPAAIAAEHSNPTSRRFEDGDPDPGSAELPPNRSSILLQLIACGGSVAAKGRSIPCLKQQVSTRGGGGGGESGRRSTGSVSQVHKDGVCKSVAAAVAVAKEEDGREMIRYMSENPRFGNLHAEEKEYFSGSIVEIAMNKDLKERADQLQVEPALKKSSSYNQERSNKTGLEKAAEAEAEEARRRVKEMKGKCIPRRKNSCLRQNMK